jgi:endonuclease/exonuclease/phosphatase family metal-dependent hydrolase
MSEKLTLKEAKIPKRKILARLCISMLAFTATSDQQPSFAKEIFIENPSAQSAGSDLLRIMTANVHGWRAPDGSNNLDDLIKVIKEEKPDVVCLQEVTIKNRQLEELLDTGLNVAYDETERPGFGNVILTAHKTRVIDHFDLPPEDRIRQRGASLVSVSMQGRNPMILNSHVTPIEGFQHHQYGRLASISSRTRVNFLCGDLNSQPTELVDTDLGDYFDITQDINQPMTFPANDPYESIDFNLALCPKLSTRVVDIMSDHDALLSVFNLPDCV